MQLSDDRTKWRSKKLNKLPFFFLRIQQLNNFKKFEIFKTKFKNFYQFLRLYVENLIWCWSHFLWETAIWIWVVLTTEVTCWLLLVTTLGNGEMVSEWTKACTSVIGMVSNPSLVCSSASVDLVKSGLCIQDAPNWHLSIEITRLKCQLL